MTKPKRYLVTSALPYANGPLHIGHLAGAYISADIYVRYLRLQGEDVKFICGSDEHGAAITLRAKKQGTTAQAIVDKYHPIIQSAFEQIGLSFDIYHRTSDPLHHETSSDFFKHLHDKEVFTVHESEQYYDEEFQQFLADRYIKGTCPKCEYTDAYGDQCEKCGSDLSPTELIEPRSTLSGATPILRKTKHWYLPMNRYQTWVEEWIEGQQKSEAWKKHVLGQCRSWLTQGLQERAMTRDLDWGVKVPLPDSDGKVLYVWLDAPIGYISATKALTDDWKKYWQDPDTKLVHFIGKDNIVFHCIIFPILLHAHGEYVLPINVPANQFLNLQGDKLSTSRNWAVWVHEYLEAFPNQQDVLRYVLTANMPENKDSEFTWENFKDLNDKDLVGLLGGFIHRTLVLTHKYFGGKVPAVADDVLANISKQADELHQSIAGFANRLDRQIHQYEFRSALQEVLNVARVGNKFLAETEPWKVAKTDLATTAGILSECLSLVTILAVYLQPFLPFTAEKIKDLLQLTVKQEQAVLAGNYQLPVGQELNKPKHLFKRIDAKVIKEQINKLHEAKAAYEAAKEVNAPKKYTPVKETIVYDDFAKLDVRVGTVMAAEKVKKANKLLKLTVDLGFETRTIVSGIAKFYAPEDIVGQRVLAVVNLAPRKLRGIESQGMILTAENSDGQLVLVAPVDATAENGGVVA